MMPAAVTVGKILTGSEVRANRGWPQQSWGQLETMNL